MNIELLTEGGVKISLSERNLRTLLAKLDEPESARTLYRRTFEGLLIVTAEKDEEHYKDREPGEVHPREEAKLAADKAA